VEFSKVVNLKPIDPGKIKIEMVPGSENNYTVWLEVDSEPDSIWTKFFYDEVTRNKQIGQVMINGASVTILTSPYDFKKNIELLKKSVDCANQQVEQHNSKAEQEHEEQRRREAKGKEDIKKMREQLRR
jgi:hypothetical protein